MVGMDGKVRRHKWVKVEAMNTMGKPIKKKYEGWEARVFQHEYDHLEGKVLSTSYILSPPPSVYLAVMSSRPIFGRRTSLHCQLGRRTSLHSEGGQVCIASSSSLALRL